ncbi:SAM and SH3 domain-containing protein 1-like isoform X2 [Patiria miniata]|uniref:SAM domain-containing protein n=1 Tax=Patiria miniata TaxID=46514 RepID=A0A913Z8M6_PATMI|nr:SAM and SH3 domain-containing protein 1-like isoform X2 [Patiria miniata]
MDELYYIHEEDKTPPRRRSLPHHIHFGRGKYEVSELPQRATTWYSESSNQPTSPDHAMSGSTDGGSGGTPETKRGRSLKKNLKALMRTPRKQKGEVPAPNQVSVQGQQTPQWRAADSKLPQEEIMQIFDEVKQGKSTIEEAWAKVDEREAELLKQQNTPDPIPQSPPLDWSPRQVQRTTKPINLGSSAEVSPVTPSDTDESARGATASDVSPHTYDETPDAFLHDNASATDVFDSDEEDNGGIGFQQSLNEAGLIYRNPLQQSLNEAGLIYRNPHAQLASHSEEEVGREDSALSPAGPDTETSSESTNNRHGSTPALPGDQDYLEPSPVVNPKRGRSVSTPAVHVSLSLGYFAGSYGSLVKKRKDPIWPKSSKSVFGKFKELIPNMPRHKSLSPSPDGPDGQGGSEASDGSLDRCGTFGSSASTCSSSKSSGETETQQPSYEVDSDLLDSEGEYRGKHLKVVRAIIDVDPSPHDVTLLPLKKGDKVYVTKDSGGYWEGVQGKRRGNFKFIHVEQLSKEELEKEKLNPEEDTDTDDIQVMPTFANLKELLELIECEQYFTTLYLHDFGNLEQFKQLEEGHLSSLSITDPKHIVKLTTAAQMLRNPKAGKDRAKSQHIHGLFSPTRQPKGRMMTRDSGFYASTETCVSFDSSGLHRCSETGDSLIEECETAFHGEEMMMSPSDDTLQENSNVNNSNCINSLRSQNGSPVGRMGNPSCRHSGGPSPNFGNGHHISGSPSCPRKEGNGSASPLSHHICRVQSNGVSTKCGGQHFTNSPGWNGRDSPSFQHRHLMATFSDPGSAPNSPRLRPGQRSAKRCPLQSGHSADHQCPSPDVVPKVYSDDITRWRKSALLEMYGLHDPSRLRNSGGFLQSSLAKTHPSPKLPRRVMEQYHCHALHSSPLHAASPSQQKGRRKSRSVSPHHHRHHQPHRDLMLSQNSVHGSPTLPLRPNKSPQPNAQLEWRVEQSLRQEGIDLKEEPYSNKMGFCGIPPALVQRYAEEQAAEVSEVAACLESLRVRDLVDSCRCWFRSDTLASQSSKLVYAGTGNTIEEWLMSLGLPMYVESFTLNGWDELDIVIHMDKEDLRKCGIDRLGHLRRLSTALEHLKMSWKPV